MTEYAEIYADILHLTKKFENQTNPKKLALLDSIRDNLYVGLVLENHPCMPVNIKGIEFLSFRVKGDDYYCNSSRLQKCLREYEAAVKFSKVMDSDALLEHLHSISKDIVQNYPVLEEKKDTLDTVCINPGEKKEKFINKEPEKKEKQQVEKVEKKTEENSTGKKKEKTEEFEFSSVSSEKKSRKNQGQRPNEKSVDYMIVEPLSKEKKTREELRSAEQEKTNPNEPKAVQETGTWICPTCGMKNGGKFCMECGRKKITKQGKKQKPVKKEETNFEAYQPTEKVTVKKNEQEDLEEKLRREFRKEQEEKDRQMREMQKKLKEAEERAERERKERIKESDSLKARAEKAEKERESELESSFTKNEETPETHEDNWQDIQVSSMPVYRTITAENDVIDAIVELSWESGVAKSAKINFDGTNTAEIREEGDNYIRFHIDYCPAGAEIKGAVKGSVSGLEMKILESKSINEADETEKNLSELELDEHNIRIKSVDGSEPDSDYVIRVMPLEMPKTTDGRVYVGGLAVVRDESGKYKVVHSDTDGGPSIVIRSGKHSFIVRTMYQDGVLSTAVSGKDQTADLDQFILSDKNTAARNPRRTNMHGHPVIRLNMGDEDNIIHIMPLSNTNSANGYAPIAVCIDTILYTDRSNNVIDDIDRSSFVTNSLDHVQWHSSEGVYRISAKWEDKVLKADIEKC